MDRSKRRKLEKAGWRVGTAAEFLELTTAEEVLVDMKVTLGTRLRRREKGVG